MWDVADTIAAIASASSGAVRGIVRVSGPASRECLDRVFRGEEGTHWSTARGARRCPGYIAAEGLWGNIPCAVYVWPTEASYTRQPSFEVHTSGAPPVLDAVLQALCGAGARLARPGEFTLRAFLAGRLDLTQAEAVLGVIDASDQRALDTALRQLAGGLAAPLLQLREQMLDLLAHLEAGLDFVEEDIQFISRAELERQLDELASAAQQMLDQMERRDVVDAEASVVLRGRPNAGKSSLFNQLLGGDHALVSDEAGTTRDYVTGLLSNAGRRIKLIDTAGVDEGPGQDEADRMAREVSRREAEQAAAQVLCLDSSRALDAWELAELARAPVVPRLIVLTKCDRQPLAEVTGSETLRTSCVTGEGIAELRQRMVEVLNDSAGRGGVVPQTAARCAESLRRVEAGLERAAALVQSGAGDELTAVELRLALDELGAVTGAVYTEDILDRIFGRFCIGK